MLRFYGQAKFDLNAEDKAPIGYELFMRERQGDKWVLPADFTSSTADEIADLLSRTIAMMPTHIKIVSFNLEQSQFIDPDFCDAVARVQAQTPIKIYTELTERTDPNVSEDALYAAARNFHEHGLLVCIDDVGTGDNTPEFVMNVDAYIDEYKFALQNFRPFAHISEIQDKVAFWWSLAREKNKTLAIEGIENAEDLDVVRKQYPCDIVQGYYLARPELLPIQGEPAATGA